MPNSTVPAAAEGLPAYGRDQVIHDADRLHHLLSTIDDLVMEMDYGHGETRNHDLDRVSALIRIALGLSERLSANVEGPQGELGFGKSAHSEAMPC
jgi:hypothetical protein